MAQNIISFKIEIEGRSQTIQELAKIQVALGKVAAERKELTNDYKAGLISEQQYEVELAKITTRTISLRDQKTKLNKALKQQKKELEVNEGSMAALKIQTAKLQQELMNLDTTTEAGKKRFEELSIEVAENREQIISFGKSINDGRENVGQYAEDIQKASIATGGFGQMFGKVVSESQTNNFAIIATQMEDVGGAAGNAVGGVKNLGKSFKVLLANPVVLILSLIVGALSALFSAFKKSKTGAELLTKATGIVNGLMSMLVGISERVAQSLKRLFDDPIAAIKDFGKAVIENIINRFEATLEMAGAVGRAIGSLLKGDFDAAKNAAKDAGTAMTQFTTGLDGEQQKAFASSLKDATEEVRRQTNAFVALEEAKKNQIRINTNLGKSIENLTTQVELNNQIADDGTLSFKVREEAAEKARIAIEKRAAKEIQLAKNSVSLINQEIALRKANGENISDLLQQQGDAVRGVIAAERELLLAERENDKQRRELKQDRLEKDLDILIDGFDNQKTINERLIDDERKTFEERFKILEKTEALAQKSFDKQIATIQQFTGLQVNANALLAEQDATRLNQRIRDLGLSEIIEGRLLEIIRERKTALSDLNGLETELNKTRLEQEAAILKEIQQLQNEGIQAEINAIENKFEREKQLKKQAFEKEITDLEAQLIKKAELSELEVQKNETINKLILAKKKQLNDDLEKLDKQAYDESLDGKIKAIEENADKEKAILEGTIENTAKLEKAKQKLALETARKKFELLQQEALASETVTAAQLEQLKLLASEIEQLSNETNERLSVQNFIQNAFGVNAEMATAIKDSTGQLANDVYNFLKTKRDEEIANELNETIKSSENIKNTRLENLESEKKEGLITEAEYNSQKEAIEMAFERTKERAEKRAFEQNKKAQLNRLAIESAVAAIKLWVSPGFPAAIPMSLVLGANYLMQRDEIKRQEFPQAERGMKVIGRTHKQGGELVELEHNEVVLNAASMSSDKVLNLTGTPLQIADALNRLDNNGDAFLKSNQIQLSTSVPTYEGGFGGKLPSVQPSVISRSNSNNGITKEELMLFAELISTKINNQKTVLPVRELNKIQTELEETNTISTWSK